MSRQMTLSVGLSDHACFDNYFTGDNAETIQAIKNLIDERSGQLALFGPAGSGKTHLLYAAQKMSMAAAQRATYFSISDEHMLRQFGGFDDLGELVCVDNIELAAGNNRLERLLFNLIEQTSQAGRALLTACGRPLAECAFLMADLVSRLQRATSYRLHPLTDNQKASAMRLRARQRGFALPEEVIGYVMKRLPRDTAALFALLDRIDRISLSEQRTVSIPLIKMLEEKNGKLGSE
jgi:DnaA family protein